MSLLDTPLMPLLTRALDLTAQRQTLVSQNIANIDTPGYHTDDIDFRQELQRAWLRIEDERGQTPLRAGGSGADRAARRQQRQHRSREPADGAKPAPVPDARCSCCTPSSTACSWPSTEAAGNEPFRHVQISGVGTHRRAAAAGGGDQQSGQPETTRTAEGGPYRRRMVVFQSQPARPFICCWPIRGRHGRVRRGGSANQVVDDPTPPVTRYEPGHPDADASGYVAYPAINPVQEMVDLMGAERAYEFNASAVQAAKQMIQQSLQILK